MTTTPASIGLPAPLVDLLRKHRVEQENERATAGQLWHEGGWIFTSQTGEPIHFRTDNKHRKELLRQAGVPDVRLQDAPGTRPPPFAALPLAATTPTRMVVECCLRW